VVGGAVDEKRGRKIFADPHAWARRSLHPRGDLVAVEVRLDIEQEAVEGDGGSLLGRPPIALGAI
jgi:hypothetical protein